MTQERGNPSKPRLLDLFCGAGGAAMGYHRAGFEVVGVDIKLQPRYPFEFRQADALTVMAVLLTGGFITGTPKSRPYGLRDFNAIHASPPCQAYSSIAKQQRTRREYDHPDLVGLTRATLRLTGLPWAMENVEGAPMTDCIVLCGSSFGLDVRRHRLFELGGFDPLFAPPCAHHMQTPRFVTLDKRRYGKASRAVAVHGTRQIASVVGVHGHINYAGEMKLREAAMGIDWMNPYELTQAIPPAYTQWLGARLIEHLRVAA